MARALTRTEGKNLWAGSNAGSRRRPSKSGLFLIGVLMPFLIGASLFYVWSRIQVIQLGYEISNAVKEERTLTEAGKKLRLEIAQLKSYGRIEQIAVEKLNMMKPAPDQVVVIR